MKGYLLDVNVLIALFDPAHPHHELVHRWFARHRAKGWATCPLTENGLVRILSHPTYPSGSLLANEVLTRLQAFRASGQHRFWADDVTLVDSARFDFDFIRAPKQLTDIYLLGLAEAHDGKLATLDQSIPTDALTSKDTRRLELIH